MAFSSTVHGDPGTGHNLIFYTYAGDPVRFRVAVPASEQFHSFNVAGHEFPWEPYMTGSQLLTARSLAAAETQEVKLVSNAALFRVLPNPFTFSAISSSSGLAAVDG